MRTRTKVWLITATFLVLVGCLLFAGVMTMLEWDFTKLSTTEYETLSYEVSGVFDEISIDTDTADIVFASSDNGKCRVECHEDVTSKHAVAVEDGMLSVELIDERSVYDLIGHIGLNFGTPRITVYLPETEYTSLRIDGYTGDVEIPNNFTFETVDISSNTGDINFYASAFEMLKIKTSTGDICAADLSVGTLDFTTSTGDITISSMSCKNDVTLDATTGTVYLTDIRCKSVISSGNTGDIALNHVIATEKVSIERDSGDVKFDSSDAAELFVKTDTGDVTGNILNDKVFIIQTDTGDVSVPKTMSGGKCEIITDTGDIKLDIR